MKAKLFTSSSLMILRACLALSALLLYLAIQPVRAAPATIVGGSITTNTDWNLAGSPYLVNSYVDVVAGVTLTIEPGVIVGNYSGGGSQNYNFNVEGTLVANGTALLPILFNPGSNGWSGINITGQPGAINTGSILNYVIAESGGYGGSGVGANLRLQYAVVDVHHCQFNHSPGDGILGDDASAQGDANIYDSSFTGNAGYAVDFQDGSVNPVLSNLTASGNGASLPYGGNMVYVNDATLHGAHTWENMGLPYLILGTNVGPDGVLTIQPGVQVLSYPGNDALDVQGKLVAIGTASQPIQFDPIDPTLGWAGIMIAGTDIQPSIANVFSYVSITKGGFYGGCDLYVTYGDATVVYSQLDGGLKSGVCLNHGATLTMANSQLTNNQEYAMDLIDAGAFLNLENLSASGNMSDTIGVEGGTLLGTHTWSKSGINTYDLFYSAVTVAPTGTLTIEPGVTVLFGETRDITVRGTLNAIGTLSEPITFTGETATPGFWGGLSFIGTAGRHAVGKLAYATLEYAGYGGSAMIYIENADVNFTHCILRYCSHDAIEIQPGRAVAAETVQLSGSRLHNIGGYAIQNGSTQAVQALYNWWGAASGPSAADNPAGTGSALNGLVLYRPYITGPDGSFIYLPVVKRP